MEESAKMAETAIVYKNVADGLDTVEEATDSIISTMKAFGIESNNTMGIIDRFNEVGNNFAITSAGIGDALQRSASALYAGGNTIDESIALVTAANSVIQNPEQVGTALKTLSLRIRGVKTELQEAGLETEGMAETTSQLQAKLKALTHGKVDIMLNADTFKNTTQILREMSAVWEEMTDMEQAAALELLGGKRQANILASVITNFETVEEVIETSMNSSGSAMAENAKWMDSIAGKSEQLSNNMQTMWENTLNSEVIKFFYDLAIGATDLIKEIGLIGPALAGVLVYFTAFKKQNPVTIFKDLITHTQQYNQAVQKLGALKQLNIKPPETGFLDETSVARYASIVSDLTAKQQAQLLATQGLTKEQIKQVLVQNNVAEADANAAIAATQLAATKTQVATVTGNQILALQQETQAQLSNKTMKWLAKNAEKELTEEKIKAAMASNKIQAEDYETLMSLIALKGGTDGATFSFKALGASMKAAFSSNPIGFILTIASTIISVIGVVDALTQSTDDLRQSVVNTANEYAESVKNIESQNTKAKELAETYHSLVDGVDALTNTNINLTTESYEKYLDVCNQIADIYPDMVRSYDEQGNAILSLRDNVEQLTASYRKAAEGAALTLLTKENKKDAWKLYEDNAGIIKSGFTNNNQPYDITVSDQKRILEAINSMNPSDLKDFYEYDKDGLADAWDVLRKQMQQEGTYVSDAVMMNAYNEMSFDLDSFDEYRSSVNLKLAQIDKDIADSMKGISETLSANLVFDSTYQKLDKASQDMVQAFINGINPDVIAKSGADDIDELYNYIRKNIINVFDDPAVANAIAGLSELQIKFADGDMAYQDYQAQLSVLLSKLQEKFGPEALDIFKISLGIDESSFETQLNTAKKLLNDAGDAAAGTLTKADLEIVNQYADEWLELYGAEIPLQRLIELIHEAREAAGEFSVSSMIDDFDTLQSDFSKLGDAYEAFSEHGIVTAETLAEINDAFGGVDGFDDFIAVLGNSNSSMDEVKVALNGLATEYLNTSGVLNNLTAENEQFIISQLKAFGVINAEEYIAGIRSVQEKFNEQYNIDLSNYATVEAMKQQIAGELYVELVKIEGDTIDELADKYGDDVRNFASAEKAKTAIAIQAAKDQAAAQLTADQSKAETEAKGKLNATTVQAGDIKGSGIFEWEWTKSNKLTGESYEDVRSKFDNGDYDGERWKSNIESWLNDQEEAAKSQTDAAKKAAQKIYDDKIAELNEIESKLNALDDLVASYVPTLSFDPSQFGGPGDDNSKSKSSSQFEKTFDWIEIRIEEINEKIDLMKAKLENAAGYAAKNNIIDNIMSVNKSKMADLQRGLQAYKTYIASFLGQIPAQYRDMAANGAFKISDFAGDASQETVEAIEKYREYLQKIADLEQQIEEIKTENSDLAKEKFDNISTEYQNRIDLKKTDNDQLESRLDLTEGDIKTSKGIYDTMIGNISGNGGILAELQKEKRALEAEFANTSIIVGSDAWYEMKQAIKDVDSEILQYKTDLEDLQLDKFNLVADDYEKQIDSLKEANDLIEARADLMEDQGFEAVNKQYDQMIGNTVEMKKKLEEERDALQALFEATDVPEYSEEWYEMKNAISDVDSEIIECTENLEDLAQKKLEEITNEFDNIVGLIDHANEQLDAQIGLMEESGEIASPKYYEEMIANTKEIKKAHEEELKALQATLDEQVALDNIEVGDDSWYEQVEAINSVESEIEDCILKLEQYQNAINDLHWERFDELIQRLDYVRNEAQNLIDIISDEKMVITPDNEDGWSDVDVEWSKDGLATMGLHVQNMENAKYQAQQYAEAIDELNQQYKAGRYSESEYLEKLNELKDAQYDQIKAYQDEKDALIDLHTQRVDAIKDGINKQIEAHQELTDAKKEQLDAEKDLHDFQKSIMEQQKDIATLERQLAALANDNSASARAKRAKLEEELYEARQALDDTYYDRSITNQQEALDKELEDFQTQKNAEIERWEQYLDNVDLLVQESLFTIQMEADAIYEHLKAKGDEYNLALSEDLMIPWQSAADEARKFGPLYDELKAKASEHGEHLAKVLAEAWAKGIEAEGPYKALFADLEETANKYGTTLNAVMDGWANGETAIGSYDTAMESSKNATIAALDAIKDKWSEIIEKMDEAAKGQIEINKLQDKKNDPENKHNNNKDNDKDTKPKDPPPTQTPTDTNKPTTGGTNTSGGTSSNKPAKTEQEKYGVALAIWNGGYGWGAGQQRIDNLKAKGFNPSEIQSIVDQMGVDGYVHTAKWMKMYNIHNLDPYHLNKFAKGTTGVKNSQFAWIDELGEELVMHADGNGKLAFLSKGSSVIPHDLTENLMKLGSIDPQDMLDRNRPAIAAPHVVNNEININMDIAEVVHIDHVDNNTLPDLTKAVRKEMDSYMLKVNNAIKSKVR